MKKQMYIPEPIDTTSVELPPELIALTEKMAKNCHEVWSATRISQGWKYGPERDDERKEHPCLIPYSELSEEEREFDRNTSLGTLKLILKLGYSIKKEDEEGGNEAENAN